MADLEDRSDSRVQNSSVDTPELEAEGLFTGKFSTEAALERMRKRLLDLSTNNRLLNYRFQGGEPSELSIRHLLKYSSDFISIVRMPRFYLFPIHPRNCTRIMRERFESQTCVNTLSTLGSM
jgi:hypothetical protein